jgi:hypothetical protein
MIMLKPTVFVVQNSPGKNLDAAKRRGELEFILRPSDRSLGSKLMQRVIGEALASWKPGDFIACMGDPVAIAIAVAIVLEKHDSVNVLRWNRKTEDYDEMEITPNEFPV